MSLINGIDLTEQEVIRKLEESGIQVVFRPMALISVTTDINDGSGKKEIVIFEEDIYTVFKRIAVRKHVIGDPFSDTKKTTQP